MIINFLKRRRNSNSMNLLRKDYRMRRSINKKLKICKIMLEWSSNSSKKSCVWNGRRRILLTRSDFKKKWSKNRSRTKLLLMRETTTRSSSSLRRKWKRESKRWNDKNWKQFRSCWWTDEHRKRKSNHSLNLDQRKWNNDWKKLTIGSNDFRKVQMWIPHQKFSTIWLQKGWPRYHQHQIFSYANQRNFLNQSSYFPWRRKSWMRASCLVKCMLLKKLRNFKSIMNWFIRQRQTT